MKRVGIVGTAHVHAGAYAEILADMDDVEYVGVSEAGEGLRSRWTGPGGGPTYENPGDLIDAGLDAAIVCTPTNEHRAAVELLADAGVDVLCEKPLATGVEDARAIVDVCESAGVLLMTAFPMRFSAPLVEGASWIADGRIGSVIAFTGTNNGQIPTDRAAWFADPVAAGGGAVMDHTVHLVDVMRWWLGAEPIEVYAETSSVLHPGVDVETAGIITVVFDDWTIATIDCSWSRPAGYPTWGGLTIETVGTGGVFTVDAFAERLDVWSGGTNTRVDWGRDPNRDMIAHFVGASRGDHPLAVTGVDGLRATEVALAAYRSVASGQPVQV